MRQIPFILLCLLTTPAVANSIDLPCTADVGITSVAGKFTQSNGHGISTPIRQNQNWQGFENKTLLMAFDTKKITGWKIDKAYLHLYVARGQLFSVGLCEVLAPWGEGATVNFEEKPGSACWSFAKMPADSKHPQPGDLWAWPGSTIASVSWSHPAARYSHATPPSIERHSTTSGTTQPAYVELRIPVDSKLVESMSAGTSFGMILTDDKGQVNEALSLVGGGIPYIDNDSEDAYVFTRECQDPALRPRLEVEGHDVERDTQFKVPTIRQATGSDDPMANVLLDIIAPADAEQHAVLAYQASYESPGEGNVPPTTLPQWMLARPAEPGQNQKVILWNIPAGKWKVNLWAVDETGRRSQVTSQVVTVPEMPKFDLAEAVKKAADDIRIPIELQGQEANPPFYAVPDTVRVAPNGKATMLDDNRWPHLAKFNSVWDSDKQTITLQAMANEVVAFNLIVAQPVKEMHLETTDLAGRNGARIAAVNVQSFRLWYMKTTGKEHENEPTPPPPGWHADACLPMAAPFGDTFSMPSETNAIEGQTNGGIFVDVYVPRGTVAGTYTGTIKLSAKQWPSPVELKLTIEVLPAEMPDAHAFEIDLNCYGGLANFAGIRGNDPNAAEAEWKFYQLAQQHRLMINALPYGQRGNVDPVRVPTLEGEGDKVHVADWAPFDARYAPLLDGSAFDPAKGYVGPGAKMPIPFMYLPFNENWPMPLEKWYHDFAKLPSRLQFAEWSKTSRPLAEAMDPQYQTGYSRVAGEFADHFAQKGWTHTRFQVFYNDKYFYKVPMFSAAAGSGAGASFWLLDESVDYDDYAANAFFHGLTQHGFDAAHHPEIHFDQRVDVSQPEMTRGLFDGITLWMCALSEQYNGYVITARMRQHYMPAERYWFYGGGTPIGAAPVDLERELLAMYVEGADGATPYWEVLRGRSWTKPDDLAIYYTGKNFANSGKDYPGPLPGLRMKLLRRDVQDIELLDMLAKKNSWSRAEVRAALAPLADDPSAPVLSFSKMTWEQTEALRTVLRQRVAGK